MAQIGDLYYNISQRNAEKVKAEVIALTKELDRITSGLKPFDFRLKDIGGATNQFKKATDGLERYKNGLDKARGASTGLGNETVRVGSQVSELANRLAIAQNNYRALDSATRQSSAAQANYRKTLSEIKVVADGLAPSLARDSNELRRLSSVAAQTRASIDSVSGSFNRLSTASVVTQSVRSGLLTVGFAASNSVTGMALLTGGFAAANAGGRALITTLGILAPALIGLATVAGAAKEVASLEEAQVGLAKVTDLNDEQIAGITDTLQGFSVELGISTQKLLDISSASARLGVEGQKNIEQFTKTVADLSLATDVIGDQGAERIAKFLAVTDTAAEDLGRVANEVGNIVNELGNQLPTTAARILDFTRFTGQLGSLTGVTREEVLALSAGLDSLGVTAEGAGNPLAKLFSDIQKATREGSASLEAYSFVTGETVEEFSKLINQSPVQAFLSIAEGLNRIKDSGGDVNLALQALGVTELRQAKLLRQVAGGSEQLAKAFGVAAEEADSLTSLEEEVGRATDTLANDVRELRQQFSILSQDLGEDLLPLFRGTVQALSQMVSAFSELPPVVRTTITTMTPLVALLGILAGPAGIATAVGVAVGTMVARLKDLQTLRINKDIENISKALSDIETPAIASEEAIDRLTAATDEKGLKSAVKEIAATMSGPAKRSFLEFAQSAIDTANNVAEAANKIFLEVANTQRKILALSVSSAEQQQNAATKALTDALGNEKSGLKGASNRELIGLVEEDRANALRTISQITEEINKKSESGSKADQRRVKILQDRAEKLGVTVGELSQRITELQNTPASRAVADAEKDI